MKKEVTRLLFLDTKYGLCNVSLKSLCTITPEFFMTAHNVKLLLTYTPCLSNNQTEILKILSSKIVSLETTDDGFNMNIIPMSLVRNMCRLESIEFGPGGVSQCLVPLLQQNAKSVQRLSFFDIGYFKILGSCQLQCRFDKLTVLHIYFQDSLKNVYTAEGDWSGFAALVKCSPNIKKLELFNVAVIGEAISRHPQIILEKVESLHLGIVRVGRTAGFLNVLRACKNSLNHLKFTLTAPVSPNFWLEDWFLPRVTEVEIIKPSYYKVDMQELKTNFNENVKIKITKQ